MTIALTTDPTTGLITLAVTGLAVASAQVVRIDAGGNTFAVRNGDPATVVAGAWTGYDYEAPLDTSVYYQVLSTVDGSVLDTSASTTLAGNGLFWLGHPGKPSLNFTATVKEIQPGTRKSRSVTHDVMGKTLPVPQSMRRASYAGTLALLVADADELAQVNAILDDGHVLLMRGGTDWPGYGNRYITVGDVDFAQLIRTSDGRFTVALPWTEVARPAGLALAGPGFRWVDLYTAYPTWLSVYTANPTWNDVIDGFAVT